MGNVKYRCKICKTTDIHVEAWINPNETTDIDLSLIHNGDEDMCWCKVCCEHQEMIVDEPLTK